ncbi:MAG: gluconate 2-dehydrogenase subunit 3 family protein, partial [Proteobacteria bacterium]|nr:gluconate 2-dehydrogenase subunit 3 family protein [Pseudomonadota bacterium]
LVAALERGPPWPLTLTPAERRLAGVLADLIIPADERSPSASAVGVVDFLDEWVSAPYPEQQRDRRSLAGGFAWLDAEASRRHGRAFAELGPAEHQAICDAICYEPRAIEAHRDAARFFARFRDLVAAGFYTSPAGRADLRYIGNVALARFDGPDEALLRSLGLA